MPSTPDAVKRWRRETRLRLRARRVALPASERERLDPRIRNAIDEHFPQLSETLIGFYWPFRGEVDLRGFVTGLIERGARGALPVVVEPRQPLEFRAWRPGAALIPGVWRIPIPREREIVRPEVLLVPLLGFDPQGYRLGNGGGYYDRTLAAMSPRPFTIGVGYEMGSLETIHPLPHDVPLDATVTEAGVRRHSLAGAVVDAATDN